MKWFAQEVNSISDCKHHGIYFIRSYFLWYLIFVVNFTTIIMCHRYPKESNSLTYMNKIWIYHLYPLQHHLHTRHFSLWKYNEYRHYIFYSCKQITAFCTSTSCDLAASMKITKVSLKKGLAKGREPASPCVDLTDCLPNFIPLSEWVWCHAVLKLTYYYCQFMGYMWATTKRHIWAMALV